MYTSFILHWHNFCRQLYGFCVLNKPNNIWAPRSLLWLQFSKPPYRGYTSQMASRRRLHRKMHETITHRAMRNNVRTEKVNLKFPKLQLTPTKAPWIYDRYELENRFAFEPFKPPQPTQTISCCNPSRNSRVSYLSGLETLGVLDVNGLNVGVKSVLGSLLVVTLARNADTETEWDTLDAGLPHLLVQQWVETDILSSLHQISAFVPPFPTEFRISLPFAVWRKP